MSPDVTTERQLFNPFPGLRPFETDEAHLYFGRDGQSDEIISRLAKTHFVGVVGTSGSGKSSLVRAGLLPALHGGFMTCAGSSWRIAIFPPGNNPIRNLATALIRPDVFGSREQDEHIATAVLDATLRRSALGLVEATRLAGMASDEQLLIVVDQFEELFRFKKDSKDLATQDDAAAFVKILLEAIHQTDLPIYVVLTMRSDYLGDCAQFRDLPEALNDGQYLVPRMTRDQRREAIERPVAVGGGDIAPRLVQRLLNDVGDDPDQLPILQHALMRTWEHWEKNRQSDAPIDLADYEAVGTLQDALNRHADEAYGSLPDDRSRKIAETVFKCLSEKGTDNREVRRPTALATLAAVARAELTEILLVIERFRTGKAPFLMPPAPVPLTEDRMIDISHESLIRQWQRLRQFVEEESKSRSMYLRLVDAAQRYAKKEAGLWRDPELRYALEWQTKQEPNQEWASLYDPHFQEAMRFLKESATAEEKRRQADERAAAEAREHERQRLEAEKLVAEARAEAERERAEAKRKEALLARKRIRELERIIAQIPDEAKRQALTIKYLPDSIKRLSSRQKKQLGAIPRYNRLSQARTQARFGLKLWENGVWLGVRFMGGTQAQHRKVAKLAQQWTLYANLRFEFTSAPDAEIRVAFDLDGGSWSYVGTDALAIPKDHPTMNLGWVQENVIHEFGHVLGLIHETNNPNVDLPWNKAVVYRALQGPPNNWSREQIDYVLFQKYKGIKYREFDPESVMAYHYPAEWFLDGREIKGGKVLSESDKRFVRELYPPD